MNGSRPTPPARPSSQRPGSPPPPKRSAKKKKSRKPPRKPPAPRRSSATETPWLLIAALFIVYSLIGLLIAIPNTPYWVWLVTVIAIPLLVLGMVRPVAVSIKKDWGGLMAYLGGLIMAIALAVAANYIGSERSFEGIRFFAAIAGLAGLTLMAVVLTAAAAITGAMTGERLMSQAPYSRSVIMVMTISLLGVCFGGVSGLLISM